MGRIGLINSGGASGDNDLADAVKTAVINKRAGGMGLISGRKAFQKPMKEGVAQLLNAIQDVYLSISIAWPGPWPSATRCRRRSPATSSGATC
jgi:class I fructose-bisphosphate aldolase